MNDLKQMPKELLLSKTETLVKEERRITTEILEYLREIESRMLYAELAYSSMYDFCVRHLKYSEGSAHRRISAMRLLKNLPESTREETQEKIKSGALSITNLSVMHGFLKVEHKEKKSYTNEEKITFLNNMENQSKLEVEKQFAAIQPKILTHDSTRVLTPSLTEIKFVVDDALLKKLERIKEISSHALARKNNEATESDYAKIIHRLADEYLKKHDPMLKIVTSLAR